MEIKKHTDVLATIEDFNANYEAGKYAAPWVVYVGNDTDGYDVIYSNDETRQVLEQPDIVESIMTRLATLENERVFCYEEEYEALVTNGSGWITNVDGTRTEVTYDPNKIYCIYEEEGPVTPEV